MRDHEGPETVDAGRLPPAPRPVQDRPRPAGRARRRALAGGLRRPRGGEQLGRRGPLRGQPGADRRHFLQRRRTAAFRAYYENMPLRRASVPRGIDMQLYRRVRWGTAGHLPHARHPPVPRRPGLRRRLQDCPDADLTRPLDHRRRAGGVAARRLPPASRRAGTSSASRSSSPSATATPARRKVTAWTPGTATLASRAAGSRRAGSTPRSATRSCSPATCTRTGPATSSWTTPTRPADGRHRAGLHLDHHRRRRRRLRPGDPPVPGDQPAPEVLQQPARLRADPDRARTRSPPTSRCCRQRAPGAAAHTRATFVIEDRVPGVQRDVPAPARPVGRLASRGRPDAGDRGALATKRP